MRFARYHGLGNDYLVIPAAEAQPPAPELLRWLCDRRYGVGGDGVLFGPLPSDSCDFALRLFNPDGSEFEKSGNGLRIFARYLWDNRLVGDEAFTVQTPGGSVRCQVGDSGCSVTVEMGRVSFDSTLIPVLGPSREVLNEPLVIADRTFQVCAATIGNPHCVVLCEELSRGMALGYGPLIETNSIFPNRTNVQFMKVLGTDSIQIEIWERGAGYTLASGTSGCAAAAAAHRLGLCGRQVAVYSPGGRLDITLSEDFAAVLSGPVRRICEGIAYDAEASDDGFASFEEEA